MLLTKEIEALLCKARIYKDRTRLIAVAKLDLTPEELAASGLKELVGAIYKEAAELAREDFDQAEIDGMLAYELVQLVL